MYVFHNENGLGRRVCVCVSEDRLAPYALAHHTPGPSSHIPNPRPAGAPRNGLWTPPMLRTRLHEWPVYPTIVEERLESTESAQVCGHAFQHLSGDPPFQHLGHDSTFQHLGGDSRFQHLGGLSVGMAGPTLEHDRAIQHLSGLSVGFGWVGHGWTAVRSNT